MNFQANISSEHGLSTHASTRWGLEIHVVPVVVAHDDDYENLPIKVFRAIKVSIKVSVQQCV